MLLHVAPVKDYHDYHDMKRYEMMPKVHRNCWQNRQDPRSSQDPIPQRFHHPRGQNMLVQHIAQYLFWEVVQAFHLRKTRAFSGCFGQKQILAQSTKTTTTNQPASQPANQPTKQTTTTTTTTTTTAMQEKEQSTAYRKTDKQTNKQQAGKKRTNNKQG
jgi:hypothetical protein